MLVREPDALVAHVRFDEGSVETGTMARPFRHRQTKGAETDTPDLTSTAPHSYSTARLPPRWFAPDRLSKSIQHGPRCQFGPLLIETDKARRHSGSALLRVGPI